MKVPLRTVQLLTSHPWVRPSVHIQVRVGVRGRLNTDIHSCCRKGWIDSSVSVRPVGVEVVLARAIAQRDLPIAAIGNRFGSVLVDRPIRSAVFLLGKLAS